MITKNLLVIAVQLRLLVIALQYVANYLIPDHDAKVFVYPRPLEVQKTLWDDIVLNVLGGLTQWDGQHFMHIALYGYTYENSLAFFPLLPYTVQYLAKLLHLPFLTFESQILLTFVLFNFVMFLLSACILYKLTESWFGTHRAHIATLLFCINPATIFFSAAYTECLFAFLTFALIYCSWKMHFDTFLVSAKWLFLSCLLIALSTLTRSNGLLNLGFLMYFFVRNLRNSLVHSTQPHLCIKLLKLSCNLVVLAMSIIICVAPFVFLQFYHHSNFCFDNFVNLPQEVVSHAVTNGYRLTGQYYNQSWCDFNYIPLPYSYVQEYYWNVGFLRYYELKQLPNFLLAMPVIYITLSECIAFLYHNNEYLIHLGIFKTIHASYFSKVDKKKKVVHKRTEEDSKDFLFVCVVHAFLLCMFCIFIVHIQVTTRMLFSANPAIYWFCTKKNKTFMKLYCFTYYFIGIVMFCNFLPWT